MFGTHSVLMSNVADVAQHQGYELPSAAARTTSFLAQNALGASGDGAGPVGGRNGLYREQRRQYAGMVDELQVLPQSLFDDCASQSSFGATSVKQKTLSPLDFMIHFEERRVAASTYLMQEMRDVPMLLPHAFHASRAGGHWPAASGRRTRQEAHSAHTNGMEQRASRSRSRADSISVSPINDGEEGIPVDEEGGFADETEFYEEDEEEQDSEHIVEFCDDDVDSVQGRTAGRAFTFDEDSEGRARTYGSGSTTGRADSNEASHYRHHRSRPHNPDPMQHHNMTAGRVPSYSPQSTATDGAGSTGWTPRGSGQLGAPESATMAALMAGFGGDGGRHSLRFDSGRSTESVTVSGSSAGSPRPLRFSSGTTDSAH